MSVLTSSIQHHTGGFSWDNLARQRNTTYSCRKKEVKLFIFAGDMILNLQNPKQSTKNPTFEALNKFSKIAGYESNVQNSIIFLYTISRQSENEFNKAIPFTFASRRIKYLGINLTKQCKTCTLKSTKQHWKKLKI